MLVLLIFANFVPKSANLLLIIQNASLKGQIISEQKCRVLNFPKCNEIIARISALASKMGQIPVLYTVGF